VLGGPLSHIIASKAVAFSEANKPEFKTYARKIVENAQTLAAACVQENMSVVTGGTDNHLLLIDVTPFGITGRQAASAMRDCHITLNKNAIPFDKENTTITSGLRIGTPAVTTLGMSASEMKEIAAIIKLVLANMQAGIVESGANAGKPSKIKYELKPESREQAAQRVKTLIGKYPVYPELDLEILQSYFDR
jgi:glycine hydroxymethyltransferase